MSPDLLDALDAGLAWLHDTPQPDDALAPFAAGLDTDTHHLAFNPAWRRVGQPRLPLIRLSATSFEPLADDELAAFGTVLAARVPVSASPTRDTWTLATDAHPSLLAAWDRALACPDHGLRKCDLRDDCPWRPTGRAALRLPVVAGRPVQLELFAA